MAEEAQPRREGHHRLGCRGTAVAPDSVPASDRWLYPQTVPRPGSPAHHSPRDGQAGGKTRRQLSASIRILSPGQTHASAPFAFPHERRHASAPATISHSAAKPTTLRLIRTGQLVEI